MATHRNRDLENKIESLLESPLRYKDDLSKLFCSLLSFEYVGRTFSNRDKDIWGDGEAATIASEQKFEVLAQHADVSSGGFAIIYAELRPFNRSIQRTLVVQLRKRLPDALFLFADRASIGGDRGARIHIVHAKVSGPTSGEVASQRLVLRRFRVGPGERYRTAAERLAKLDLSHKPEIGTLELGHLCDQAFDKEALTDEFFKKLDRHIRDVEIDLRTGELDLDPKEAFTQAQLLIERLVFLYFAQNRGWLNQEPDYLVKNFAKYKKDADGFSYYQEFLHRLFRSLAEPSFGDRLEGIPFLNGGLFDDDEFRPAQSKLRIRNETFATLFNDLLEAYNFTVREDTPLSQEVAVDPEMLGKIFESIVLHAESAGEEFQAPDKRKATGSYYTPRIVVHFICRESLRLYFANRIVHLSDPTGRSTWCGRISRIFKEIESDDGFNEKEVKTLRESLSPTEAKRCLRALNELRTLDPAVGSGAFPVGLLHELVSLRRTFECVANGYQDPVKGEGDAWKQKAKEHFIQSSLFGVDIQQQAIEICRLRLWLSLLVDYELGVNPFEAERSKFIEAINHISQLPNLEMNFRRGDSLHDYICGHPVRLDGTQLADYTDELALIEKKGQQLHHAKRADAKKKLRLEILARRLDLGKRVVSDQIGVLQKQSNQIADVWFGESASETEKRGKLEQEIVRLRDALKQLEKDEKEFKRLEARPLDKSFYRNLRKLEGAEPDGPHNFVWRLDFPHVLSEKDSGTVLDNLSLVNEAGQGELVAVTSESAAGFDLIVGNPPFVTARNPLKRELYRQRWPLVCHREYELVAPFFQRSFELIGSDGQLGFIVSNGFTMRDFGRPLVEQFFPTVHLQKIVDCDGLSFPGHGTPTCIIFGRRPSTDETPAQIRTHSVIVAARLPGGGDLRTIPEESPLWSSLSEHHDDAGYEDGRIVVAQRTMSELSRWPLKFDTTGQATRELIERNAIRLTDLIEGCGSLFDTHKDEAFVLPPDVARRRGIEIEFLAPFIAGDQFRNWFVFSRDLVLRPYDQDWKLLKEDGQSRLFGWLRMLRKELGGRATFGGATYDEAGEPYYRYHQMSVAKVKAHLKIAYPEIATHAHFIPIHSGCLLPQTAPVLELSRGVESEALLLAGVLNSSATLFWLKQMSFNKGAGKDEQLDRFEYQGKRVTQIPVSGVFKDALLGKPDAFSGRLISLSKGCWERGRELSSLAMRHMFEKPNEAYQVWNSTLPSKVAPHPKLGSPFTSTAELRERFANTVILRDQIQAEMIAFQEEMDWLVYAAHGLLAPDNATAQTQSDPAPLDRGQRPFRLWEAAEGKFEQAIGLIPGSWSKTRRTLWEARLLAIRDNEHVRRIEQPVYKRRWDEQWKVSNSWVTGRVAYAEEFVDAFRWWLAEKAEWHLENKGGGGPLNVDEWTRALWKDKRIEAAWPIVAVAIREVELWKFENAKNKDAKQAPRLGDSYESFARFLKETINEESVPDGIPSATPWDILAAKKKWTSAQLKKAQAVRGKLNVPRERFRTTTDGNFVWAGKV